MTSQAEDHLAWVAEANLAPSVHNTQPARWRFSGNTIELLADPARFLAIGDPSLNDAALSCGAALEGMAMVLAANGPGVASVEDFWKDAKTTADGHRLTARINLNGPRSDDPLRAFIKDRFTWRGAFAPVSDTSMQAIKAWATASPVCTLVTQPDDMIWLANQNDELSLKFFSDKPYRDELRSWMRLSRNHKDWHTDGLNAQAMAMSGLEAFGAKFALASPAFEIAKTLRLAGAMISERANTLSASGVAFFHTPAETSPIIAGRAFYRYWLELTRFGAVCWPMAIIADDPASNAACKSRFNIPDGHRLINALRFGALENKDQRADTARLDPQTLIVT